MDEVEMVVGAVAAVGRRVTTAGDDAGAGVAGVVTSIRAIAAALPGGRSAGLAQELARRWERAGVPWVAGVAAHGASLVAAAGGQERAEDAAASLLAPGPR